MGPIEAIIHVDPTWIRENESLSTRSGSHDQDGRHAYMRQKS